MTPYDHARPVARKSDLVIQEVADEVLVYNLKTHQAHCLNQTAGVVWKYCDGQQTVTEITQLVAKEMKSAVDEKSVWFALEQLGKASLLEEQGFLLRGAPRLSRRNAVLRMGASLAVPVVLSIVAPAAQAANTCVGFSCIPGAGGVNNTTCSCTGCCGSASNGAPNTCRPFRTLPKDSYCTQDCQCSSGNCTGSNKCT